MLTVRWKGLLPGDGYEQLLDGVWVPVETAVIKEHTGLVLWNPTIKGEKRDGYTASTL